MDELITAIRELLRGELFVVQHTYSNQAKVTLPAYTIDIERYSHEFYSSVWFTVYVNEHKTDNDTMYDNNNADNVLNIILDLATE